MTDKSKMPDHLEQYLDGKLTTSDGEVPKVFASPAPDPATDTTGQHRSYWCLSESERKKGFVRPVRYTYMHLKCGKHTSMGKAIAETYSVNPKFYGATFCCHCAAHFPVGVEGEFVWIDDDGQATDEKVGT